MDFLDSESTDGRRFSQSRMGLTVDGNHPEVVVVVLRLFESRGSYYSLLLI